MARFPFLLLLPLLTVASPGDASARETEGHEPLYQETELLIDLVRSAADLVAEIGAAAACEQFRTAGSQWLVGETYVFVLDLDGGAICHPARPGFEGRSLLELRDPHGIPIVRNILREVEGGEEDGWIHYLWPTPEQRYTFYWKTSYVRRVKEPGGKELVVGSGLYQMKMERFFVVEQVSDAVALIEERGEDAFAVLREKSSGFRFYDAYVFVIDNQGNTLVNVGFPEREGTNVLDLEDSAGKKFIREMVGLAREREAGWVDYLWPKPGDSRPSLKSSYVHRLELGGRVLVVGAGVYLD